MLLKCPRGSIGLASLIVVAEDGLRCLKEKSDWPSKRHIHSASGCCQGSEISFQEKWYLPGQEGFKALSASDNQEPSQIEKHAKQSHPVWQPARWSYAEVGTDVTNEGSPECSPNPLVHGKQVDPEMARPSDPKF